MGWKLGSCFDQRCQLLTLTTVFSPMTSQACQQTGSSKWPPTELHIINESVPFLWTSENSSSTDKVSHPALLSCMDHSYCFFQQDPPTDLLDPCHEPFPTHVANILGHLPCLHSHNPEYIYQCWEPVCALVWSLSIWSCLVIVIYFSLCHKLSVICMLFSKVLHFITYFLLPLLWYSITLLFFTYENKTTKHSSRDHVKLMALLHCTKHLFPSDLFKQPNKKNEFRICNDMYQHMMCRPPYLMWPLQMVRRCRREGRETVCVTCSLGNLTSSIVVMFTDATLRLQKEWESIYRSVQLLFKTQHYTNGITTQLKQIRLLWPIWCSGDCASQ